MPDNDAEITLLKAEIASLSRRIDDLERNARQAITSLNGRMDSVEESCDQQQAPRKRNAARNFTQVGFSLPSARGLYEREEPGRLRPSDLR